MRGWFETFLLGVALCITGLVACGCDNGGTSATSSASSGGKLKVVATTSMIGDLAQRIGADRIELVTIMGPGVDPHTYRPTTADLGAMSRADLVLYNGLHLEGTMAELLEERLSEKAKAVSARIPHDKLISPDGNAKVHDPHVWFDAALWSTAATCVAEALAEKDVAGAEGYRQRGEATRDAILKLDSDVRADLANVPAGRRVLITSHDAYGYFGRAYGVEVRGLQGISTESEAGVSAIGAAVEFIAARKIPAIFVESSVSHRTIERVQADAKARGIDVNIGGELYSDAMGSKGERPGFDVETYEGMFRYNVQTIVNALK